MKDEITEEKVEEVLAGKPVSEYDDFYLKLAKENIKENVNLANDILKQFITLCTALLGISLIFEEILYNDIFKLFTIIAFFIGLLVALIGVLPFEKQIDILSPSEIKNYHKKALKHKLLYVWISSFSLVSGFGIIIAKLILKIFN